MKLRSVRFHSFTIAVMKFFNVLVTRDD